MNDRELLELAAKASGIDGKYSEESRPEEGFYGSGIFTGGWDYWNPLTDDGDALRVAVKLGMWVFCGKAHVAVDYLGSSLEQSCGSDPCAATRRAIVRAAAEIGREMK